MPGRLTTSRYGQRHIMIPLRLRLHLIAAWGYRTLCHFQEFHRMMKITFSLRRASFAALVIASCLIGSSSANLFVADANTYFSTPALGQNVVPEPSASIRYATRPDGAHGRRTSRCSPNFHTCPSLCLLSQSRTIWRELSRPQSC
jgi:hypothetical protein